MNVLLTAMKARTNLDENASSGADQFTVLPCDKWEIRMLNKGAIFIFSFRVPGGAWIRLKVPQGGATSMREALEAMEGGSIPPAARGLAN
jgi:hypothetical protein